MAYSSWCPFAMIFLQKRTSPSLSCLGMACRKARLSSLVGKWVSFLCRYIISMFYLFIDYA